MREVAGPVAEIDGVVGGRRFDTLPAGDVALWPLMAPPGTVDPVGPMVARPWRSGATPVVDGMSRYFSAELLEVCHSG